MRTISALVVIPIATCLMPSLGAKDITRDKSPDGKFALQITKEDEGWGAAIINLKSKQDVAGLEIYQNFTEQAHLVWSKDSQRVAYFEPDRRGGTTHIYFRNGSTFEEVQFPSGEVPECHGNLTAEEAKKFVKTTDATDSPKAWLKSGALVIAVDESWITEDGGGSCSQTVTIAFDANRKAFVQSVADKKVD